ncbi:MAG TPA: D-glycero-beta-D-manno-heptose 1-phosphate adenylyltransferase [Sphingobacteriaceae bacterium]
MRKYELLKHKVVKRDQLNALVESWKLQHQKVVFTNGCFDLLHLGHVDYLAKAADMGDKLVIALNSDKSTRELKGPSRPITDEKSRAFILASLFFVDAVVLFDEPTPLEVIKLVRPDVLIKGADYTVDQIVGAGEVMSYGGQVKTIEYLPGYSTTSIEKKIKNS